MYHRYIIPTKIGAHLFRHEPTLGISGICQGDLTRKGRQNILLGKIFMFGYGREIIGRIKHLRNGFPGFFVSIIAFLLLYGNTYLNGVILNKKPFETMEPRLIRHDQLFDMNDSRDEETQNTGCQEEGLYDLREMKELCLNNVSSFHGEVMVSDINPSSLSGSPVTRAYSIPVQSEHHNSNFMGFAMGGGKSEGNGINSVSIVEEDENNGNSTSVKISSNKDRVKIRKHLMMIAIELGIDPRLALSMAKVESGYDPESVSPKGAIGVMQVMPEYAWHDFRITREMLFDPKVNIRVGLSWMKSLLDRFDHDLDLSLAAYNAGASRVVKAGYSIPPIKETQSFVRKVKETMESEI